MSAPSYSSGDFLWVSQGSERHKAQFIEQKGQGQAIIKWEWGGILLHAWKCACPDMGGRVQGGWG